MALSETIAPVVVDEFREFVIAMGVDLRDRSKEVFDVIENHNVVDDPRTLEAYQAAVRRESGDEPQTF